jgi:hypothetical protein
MMAMVSLAIHDAINAIPGVQRYHTSLPAQPANAGTSAVAAVNETSYRWRSPAGGNRSEARA